MAFAWLFTQFMSWLSASAILLFSVIAALLYKAVCTWKRSKLLEEYFDGPPKHWLYGSIEHFASTDAKLRRTGEEFTVKYPLGYLLWLGPFNVTIVTTHPDSVRSVVRSEPKGQSYNLLKGLTGIGLLVTEGIVWRRRRHLLTPAFHFNVLKPYVKIFNERCRKTLEMLLAKNSKPVEIFDLASNLTLDVLLQCACSYDQEDSSSEDGYLKAVSEAKAEILYRGRCLLLNNDFLYSWSSSNRKSVAACNTIHQKAAKIVAQRRKEKNEKADAIGKRNFLDFLDILLEAKDENGRGMNDSEIEAEVATFMFAGHDTTASALSWTLYLLASHQDELRKCQEEVDAVVGDKKDVEWNDLSKLTYLTLCIKESLRHRPPVVFLDRTFTKDTEIIPGKVIPAFSSVMANIYALHHHPDVWDEPEKFLPSRFTFENSKNRHPYAYIAFSAGPRNCIGQRFAMDELKVVVAQLIRSFNLNVLEGHPVLMHSSIILRAKHGIKLVFKPRHTTADVLENHEEQEHQ